MAIDEQERARELPGLDAACRALAEGRAVVVPNPSPMTYGIVATTALAVNRLKGRPPSQNVAVSVHAPAEWDRLAPIIDVPPSVLLRIVEMLRRRLSLLVPLRPTAPAPEWIAPAVQDGNLAMFNPWWQPVAPLWDGFPRLYGSSANRTGQKPAASAEEARRTFGSDAPVVDADELRDLRLAHAPSSMVRVARDGGLSLHRRGSQDAASGLDPSAYLRELASIGID